MKTYKLIKGEMREHGHGDWVRYDDIPFQSDVAETELERRQKEDIRVLQDLVTNLYHENKRMEDVLHTIRLQA